MEQNKKKRIGIRLWGILGAMWLVIGCMTGLPGCGGVQQQPAQSQQAEITTVEEITAAIETTATETTAEPEEITEKEITEKEITEEEITAEPETTSEEEVQDELTVEETGFYSSKEEVALYLHLYGHLPDNYITKREAENLGWNSKEGNLWEVAPDMSIGGSRFGNYEGALPDKEGRKYYECDIDFDGGYRGAKRIIYSDDGLIFYTEDHYKTFEQLYGE